MSEKAGEGSEETLTDSEEGQEAATVAPADTGGDLLPLLTKDETNILRRLVRGITTLPEISHEFDLSEEGAIRVLDTLQQKGYDVFIERNTKRVSLSQEALGSGTIEVERITFRKSLKFGLVSDTRLGDKSFQLSLLYDAYEVFKARNVDFVIHAGNLVAGDRPKSRQDELFLHASADQKQFVVDHYPRVDFRTYIVSGPLDLTWRTKSGYNIVRDICSARDDLIYRRSEAAIFDAKGNLIYVAHPGNDDTPYAKSYKPQKISENLVGYFRSIGKHGKEIPQIAFLGGWHVIDQFFGQFAHGTYVLPSFIAQNKHLAAKHIGPTIGCIIIEMFFDDDGNITEVKPDYIVLNKYQVEKDYLNIPSAGDLANGCTLSDDEVEVLDLVKWGPLSPGEISRKLNKSKKRIIEIVEHLKDCGLEISIPEDTKQVTLEINPKETYAPTGAHLLFGERFRFGSISDTHGGSLQQQPSLWDMAYEIFDKEDVDFIVHAGDVTDGCGAVGYRGHANDVFIAGADDQKTYMVKRYPRSKKGKRTKMISGNHDGWAVSAIGYNIVRHLSELRDDIDFLGHMSGVFEHKGLKFKALHPAGGQGYAKSYKPQRLIESDISNEILALTKESDGINVLLLGNWHHYHFIYYMGTFSFTLPCLKTSDDFHETHGFAPFLGVVIVELTLDKDGDIIAISPRFINLAPFAKEHDY